MPAHKILLSHVDWRNFCIHLRSLKIPPKYSKPPLSKTMIQIKLAGMSMIFHCTKLRLPNSKCKGSWVVSIQQNVNLKFWTPTMFVFCGFHKISLSAYKISWSHIDWWKFCIHLSSLNVCSLGMVKAMRLNVTGMASLLNFTKIYRLVHKFRRGTDMQTGRWSQISQLSFH
jgi:hypothetical protein